MSIYRKPQKKIHKGFYFLDDETLINSLSAVESGKVDEVVAKLVSAKEGGISGGIGFQGAKLEAGKKVNSSFEEEMVRTRTRFSVFSIWYDNLIELKGLGHFNDWGPDALTDLEAGDTVELRATLTVAPIHTMRLIHGGI